MRTVWKSTPPQTSTPPLSFSLSLFLSFSLFLSLLFRFSLSLSYVALSSRATSIRATPCTRHTPQRQLRVERGLDRDKGGVGTTTVTRARGARSVTLGGVSQSRPRGVAEQHSVRGGPEVPLAVDLAVGVADRLREGHAGVEPPGLDPEREPNPPERCGSCKRRRRCSRNRRGR